LSGFTRQLLTPDLDGSLLSLGLGLTNLVDRATAVASDLRAEELVAGIAQLERKVQKYSPRWLAVLGIDAFRTAFEKPHARPGRQAEQFGGAGLWVLPNPSGLNAHYQKANLAEAFAELCLAASRQTSHGVTTA
jgi:TDG/mug DNA glycosylase family protein